jgi:hypothetical protein
MWRFFARWQQAGEALARRIAEAVFVGAYRDFVPRETAIAPSRSLQ